jgi:YfiH family protein
VARVRFTRRADGDLSARQADEQALAGRRAAVVALPWFSVRQVHGDDVRTVDTPVDRAPSSAEPPEGDALVTRLERVVLSVNTADCAPVALVGRRGVIGAAHAGWKGLAAGVVGQIVGAMRRLGSGPITAYLGPCIHPECYEFGLPDLERLEGRFGPGVRGRSAAGRPSLDLPAAVARALGDAGVPLVHSSEVCTACATSTCFSHRARGDAQRHALAVWIDDESTDG